MEWIEIYGPFQEREFSFRKRTIVDGFLISTFRCEGDCETAWVFLKEPPPEVETLFFKTVQHNCYDPDLTERHFEQCLDAEELQRNNQNFWDKNQ